METLDARAAALARHMTIALPQGEGPFPVVLQFHGCGGRKAFQDRYAETARRAGIAAVVVDSFAHRGISTLQAYMTVCLGLALRGAERAGDVLAALAWVRAQAWADPERLALAGWSHGGWTVMEALALSSHADAERRTGLAIPAGDWLAGVLALAAVYPYCGTLARTRRDGWRRRPATLAILGDADQVVGWREPMATFARLEADGVPCTIRVFEGATHAFEEAEARDLRVRYDPVAEAEAHRLYAAFLVRSLGGA